MKNFLWPKECQISDIGLKLDSGFFQALSFKSKFCAEFKNDNWKLIGRNPFTENAIFSINRNFWIFKIRKCFFTSVFQGASEFFYFKILIWFEFIYWRKKMKKGCTDSQNDQKQFFFIFWIKFLKLFFFSNIFNFLYSFFDFSKNHLKFHEISIWYII